MMKSVDKPRLVNEKVDGRVPAGFLPVAQLPAGNLPEGFSPAGQLPAEFHLSESCPRPFNGRKAARKSQ